jgi:hypothetical protein
MKNPRSAYLKRNSIDKKNERLWNLTIKKTYFGLGIVWFINIATVLRSSWVGDDWPNSQAPYWIQWRYGILNNWNIWGEAMFWNEQWMDGAGRFYPFTWIESRFIFSYFRELWQYKMLQTVTLTIVGLFFIYVIHTLSKSHILAIGTLAFLSLTVQYRRDFDPHLGFSLMLTSIIGKLLIALCFAYLSGKCSRTPKGVLWSLLSATTFFIAMSTYEFAFLLFPVLAIGFMIGRLDEALSDSPTIKNHALFMVKLLFNIRFTSIFLAWIGYGVYVFGVLRPNAAAISGVYVLGISWSSIKVFISQAFMGLPLISWRSQDIEISQSVPIFALILIVFGAYSLVSFSRFVRNDLTRLQIDRSNSDLISCTNLGILGIAVNLILAPGLMMSMQPTWWSRADLGHSYLGVMISEFGTALLFSLVMKKIILSGIWSK